eukprot:c22492_g1_i1 orf=170-1081(+)
MAMAMHNPRESSREPGVTEKQENGNEAVVAFEGSGGIKGRLGSAFLSSTKFVGRHPVAAAAVAGAVATPLAVPLVVQGLGFTSAGIAASTWAAGFMSSYSGVVATNSACAVLQSVGAAGLGAKGVAAASVVGGATTGGMGKLGRLLFGRGGAAGADGNAQKENGSEQSECNNCEKAGTTLEERKHVEKHMEEIQREQVPAAGLAVKGNAYATAVSTAVTGGVGKLRQVLSWRGGAVGAVQEEELGTAGLGSSGISYATAVATVNGGVGKVDRDSLWRENIGRTDREEDATERREEGKKKPKVE